MRGRRRSILCAAALIAAFLAAPTPSYAAQDCLTGSLTGRVPVLLVHGFNSNPGVWGFDDHSPSATSAVVQLCSSTTHLESFDYSSASTQWVTDQEIGPRLARAIADLAERSRAVHGSGKVVVVAHSMGGLAIRCALDTRCGGQSIRNDVGGVVTFGTPNHGTFLKGYALSLPEGMLLHALSAQCHQHFVALLCEFVDAIGTSPAGHAFTPGSGEEKSLPAWPQGMPTRAVAGKISLTTSLFGHVFHLGDVGDAIVGVDSAHGDAGTRARTIDCGSLGVAAAFTLRPVVDLTCTHVSEPADARFLAEAKQVIEAASKATQADPRSGGPPIAQVIAPYVGSWYAHGGGLEIRSDLTGSQKTSLGPCVIENVPDSPYCNQVVTYRFSAADAQGSVSGTVTKIGYETWGGGNPPAGFAAGGDMGFRVGQAVTLRKPKKDMVTLTVGSQAVPFCLPDGASAAAGECGA